MAKAAMVAVMIAPAKTGLPVAAKTSAYANNGNAPSATTAVVGPKSAATVKRKAHHPAIGAAKPIAKCCHPLKACSSA
jgi:hypothetical protein